jgi:energy-coupling factor transport system permease protein
MLTLVVFIVSLPLVCAVLAFSFLGLWAAAKMPFKKIGSYIKYLFWVLIFVTIMQLLFGPGDRYILKPLFPESIPFIGGMGSLKWDGLILGLVTGLRLMALVVLLPMLTMSTEINLMSLGLVRMGMPYKIAYIITTALNLVPAFEREARIIMDAQKMRGLRAFEEGGPLAKLRAYPALALPLIIGAMRRAQMMGAAMDARAFGAYPVKTYIDDIKMSFRDYAAITACVIFSALALTANFILR